MNSPTQVVAKQPGADVFLLLRLVERPVGRNIEEVALRAMEEAGFARTGGSRTSLNGLEAFLGTYQGTIQDLGRVTLRAAHAFHNRNVFMIAGIAPVDAFDRAERDLATSIGTFRPLTAAQAEALRPNRIDLYTARQGDTWESIAERSGRGVIKPATLATMNGHSVTDQPREGQRLKIVVAG
jgi:predicted Zn-dependent protease